MLNLQIILFVLMSVGIAAKKLGIISKEGRKCLSDLLIYIILPCNIIHSFMGKINMSSGFVKNCALAFALSAVIQLFVTLINKLLFMKIKPSRKSVLSYGMICSNSSFIGLPVAQQFYGDLGVLYTSLFQIPIRFTMWTAGLALFTNVDGKSAFKKLIRHPCIISIFIGFAIMLLPFDMPEIIDSTIKTISNCTTPVSMIVIGTILADSNIKTMFSKDALYFSFLRLVALPVFAFLVLMPFRLDKTLVAICVIMSAMPAGSTTSILAEKYGCDSVFASQIIFVSTLLSIFTISMLGIMLK